MPPEASKKDPERNFRPAGVNVFHPSRHRSCEIRFAGEAKLNLASVGHGVRLTFISRRTVWRHRRRTQTADPDIVILAQRDLTSRKLIRRCINSQGNRCRGFPVIASAPENDARGGRNCARARPFSRTKPVTKKSGRFAEKVLLPGDSPTTAYNKIGGIADCSAARRCANLLFYLAISPSQFGEVVSRFHARAAEQGEFRLAAHRGGEAVRPRPRVRARAHAN